MCVMVEVKWWEGELSTSVTVINSVIVTTAAADKTEYS